MWVKWIQAFKEREKVCLRLLRIADRSRLEKVSKSLMPSISPLAPIWPDLTCMGYKRLERSHLPLPQVRSPHSSRQKGFGASCIKRWRTEARKLKNLRTGSMIPGRKYSGYCWTLSTIYLLCILELRILKLLLNLNKNAQFVKTINLFFRRLRAAVEEGGQALLSRRSSQSWWKTCRRTMPRRCFPFFHFVKKVFFFLFSLPFFYCSSWGLWREDRWGDAGQLERKEADEGGQERNFEGEEGRHGELVEHGERGYRLQITTKLKSKKQKDKKTSKSIATYCPIK